MLMHFLEKKQEKRLLRNYERGVASKIIRTKPLFRSGHNSFVLILPLS